MKNLRYIQVQCSRDLTSSGSFSQGIQHFNFTVEKGQRWFVGKSFLQFKSLLTKANSNQLDTDDGVAFGVNPLANAYESCRLRCQGVPIAELDSGFVAQADTLKKRMRTNKARMDSIYKELEYFEPSLDKRISKFAVDSFAGGAQYLTGYRDLGLFDGNTVQMTAAGVVTFAQALGPSLVDIQTIFRSGDILRVVNAGANSYYQIAAVTSATTLQLALMSATAYQAFGPSGLLTSTIWRQRYEENEAETGTDLLWEFGQMLCEDSTLPPGNYQVELVPYSGDSYKTRMIQSKSAKTPGVDYNLQLTNGYFWIAVADMESKESTESHFIEHLTVRSTALPATTGRNDLRYDVPESTVGITVCTQSATAGFDSTHCASLFTNGDGVERKLTRLNIQYKGQNSNTPELDPSYKVGNLADYRKEMWRKNLQNSGQFIMDAGCETFADWGGASNRVDNYFGQYYFHPFFAELSNVSTSCIVTSQFATAPSSANQLVIAHTTRQVIMKLSDGKVSEVRVMEVMGGDLNDVC